MPKVNGFSLLELIGVMAVMAILAGAIAPTVFQMIKGAKQTAEAENLSNLAQALTAAVQNNKHIPTATPSDWSGVVAEYAALAPAKVLNNENNFARRLYFDPRFFSTSEQNFPGYTQSNGLTNPPNSPRAILASSLDQNLPTTLNTAARFDAVWDQTSGALIVESKRELVERINLTAVFIPIMLSNANTSQVGFQVENSTAAAIPAATGGVDGTRTVYLISGSRLSLQDTLFPSGTIQRQLFVTHQTSLRYSTDGFNWKWE